MKHFYLARLAARNLFRYKRRTVITLTVLAMGIAGYILMDSLLIGTKRESELALIYYEMGEGRLVTPAYWDEWKDRPLAESLEDPDGLARALEERGIPAAVRTEFTAAAVIRTGVGGSFPLVVTALDTKEDTRVNRITETVREGRLPDENREEAAIGEWFAQDTGVGVGDTLTLQITDRWGSREAMEVEITGLVNSPNSQINKAALLIPRSTADDYLALGGAASMVMVDLPLTRRERDKALAAIDELAPDYGAEYHGWRDWSADYLSAAGQDTYSTAVILFLIFIIASVGLANTMLMAVMERQKEIGMMRSLGMSECAVMRLFLYEAGSIGLLGSLAGILLAALGNIPLVMKGLDYTFMMREFSVGYRFSGIIHGVWNFPSYLFGLAAGILICLTVTWLSVKKIVARSITDEIRAA